MLEHRVVVLGGGFAGLELTRHLHRAPCCVTLVDRRNFHLFQPLLYQVATGGLSPANICAPLRAIFKRQKNAEVVLAEVTDFDLAGRRVLLADGHVEYDTLAVAVGSETSYFGHDSWADAAPGLKTLEDATEIRRRVLLAFERAERSRDPHDVRDLLTFVVVGGGPTGVELAGTLAEIARFTLRNEFRRINPHDARILLVEGTDRVLPPYPPRLSQRALEQLKDLGVEVRCGAMVSAVDRDSVTLRQDRREERIRTSTVLWGAGVRGNPLGRKLAEAAGLETDRAGRVPVEPDCTLRAHPEVFVLGDLAHLEQDGRPLPGVAPVAMQQGRYAARLIRRRLTAKGEPHEPFRYREYGTMATIGRARAVAVVGRWQFSGYLAWLAWLFVHLMYLVEFEARLLVLFQWSWNYFTWNRAARLITGRPCLEPRRPEPAP